MKVKWYRRFYFSFYNPSWFFYDPSWSESNFILFLFFYSIRVGPSRSESIRPGLAVRVDPVRLLYPGKRETYVRSQSCSSDSAVKYLHVGRRKIQISLPPGEQDRSNTLPQGQQRQSNPHPMPCLPPAGITLIGAQVTRVPRRDFAFWANMLRGQICLYTTEFVSLYVSILIETIS